MMRVLLLSSAYNSMCQNIQMELLRFGHEVSVELAQSDDSMRDAVRSFKPELVICPMLTSRIPEDVWRQVRCIIVHPGIKGDRGPSSLDWAILEGREEWGVTLLEASSVWDGGDIWYTSNFRLRQASKSSIYRDEVIRHAVSGVLEVLSRFQDKVFKPEALDYLKDDVKGIWRPHMSQEFRAIEWALDPVETIIRKIRSGDGAPGVLNNIRGVECFLYGAYEEDSLRGKPGEIIAKRSGAICIAAAGGAVWISHLKKREKGAFKLPATMVLKDLLNDIPEVPVDLLHSHESKTFREIWYEEKGNVGFLYFEFYNGAMGTEQCTRLKEAVLAARHRKTNVLVLMGGRDYWSNGIHLNLIEAATNPADESWNNINAMNDLVHAILTTDTQITVSAMQGSAGAGGVMLALASDLVYVKPGLVLNPHYQSMGNLYGSEYWTYLLPKRVGHDKALELTQACLPIGVYEAEKIGLVDQVIAPNEHQTFRDRIGIIAENLANEGNISERMAHKKENRILDEKIKPLSEYRKEELEKMHLNFYGPDPAYHLARSNFVRKVRASKTSDHLKQTTERDSDAGQAPLKKAS